MNRAAFNLEMEIINRKPGFGTTANLAGKICRSRGRLVQAYALAAAARPAAGEKYVGQDDISSGGGSYLGQ